MILKQIYSMVPKQIIPLQVRVDLEVIVMNRYFTLCRFSKLALQSYMIFSDKPRRPNFKGGI